MRPQVPIDYSKQTRRKTYDGQWPASSHSENIQYSERKVLQQKTSSTGTSSRTERPRSLGGILANNHGVLNQIRDVDEFERNVDRFESLSVSSSTDMARATTGSKVSPNPPPPPLLPPQRQSRDSQDDEMDYFPYEKYSNHPQHERPVRRHPQPASSQDSGTVHLPAAPTPQDPPPPKQQPQQQPFRPRAVVKYWEKHCQDEIQKQREDFLTNPKQFEDILVPPTTRMKDLPMNSLADDVASPQSVSVHQHQDPPMPSDYDRFNEYHPHQQYYPRRQGTFQCHGASETSAPTSIYIPNDPPSPPTGQRNHRWPHAQHEPQTDKLAAPSNILQPLTGKLFDLFSTENLIASCSRPSSEPQEIKTKIANPTKISKESSSIWNYLDPNNDLYDSDFYNRTSDESSGVVDDNTHDDEELNHCQTHRPIHRRRRNDQPRLQSGGKHGRVPAFSQGTSYHQHQKQQDHRVGTPDTHGTTSTRNSRRSSQKQRDLRGKYPSQSQGQYQGNMKTRSHSHEHYSQNNQWQFDPFDFGEGHGDQEETPRAANNQENADGSRVRTPQQLQEQQYNQLRLRASKRDTLPTAKRLQSHPSENSTQAAAGTGGGAYDFMPVAPDFLGILEQEVTNDTIPKQEEINVSQPRLQECGVPAPPDSRHPTRSTPNTSMTSDSSLSAQKQQKRIEKLKQQRQRNFEMLKLLEEERQQQVPSPNHTIADAFSRGADSSKSTKAQESTKMLPYQREPSSNANHMYVAYSRFGNHASDVLQLCEHPNPPVLKQNGQLLVKILASSISPTDCDIRRGEWSHIRLNPYLIPGVAFVGAIVACDKSSKRAVGFGSSHFKNGDTVMGLVEHGGNARYTLATKERMIKVPPTLDPCTTVCLAETYLTAFQALHHGQRGSGRYRHDVFQGKSFLVLGGSSCLGRALIEVALAGGVDYCYALAKERQHEEIRRLGGVPLPKDPQRWLTLIGRQIDIIVTVSDSNGLYTDPVTTDHFKAINENGKVVFVGPRGIGIQSTSEQIGASSSQSSIVNPSKNPAPSKLMCRSVKKSLMDRSHSYNVFDAWEAEPKLAKKDLEHLVELLQQGTLHPEVLERVPLSKVAKVHSILESKKVPGHIVCGPWMHMPTQQNVSAPM